LVFSYLTNELKQVAFHLMIVCLFTCGKRGRFAIQNYCSSYAIRDWMDELSSYADFSWSIQKSKVAVRKNERPAARLCVRRAAGQW
jgi:hypothetical protein